MLRAACHCLAKPNYCRLTTLDQNVEPQDSFKISHLLYADIFISILIFVYVVLHYLAHSCCTVSYILSQQITHCILGNVKMKLGINDFIQRASAPHVPLFYMFLS